MSLEPYQQLLRMTELEQELVTHGNFLELAALQDERDILMADLPSVPPAAAIGTLQRIAAVQTQTVGLIAAALHGAEHDLGRLRNGIVATRGYAGPSAPSRTLDLRR